MRFIGTIRVPVVLCEHGLPGVDWVEALQGLHARLSPPLVLLLADGASATLREELSTFGVFDVLCRPLLSESLIPALEVARTHLRRPPKAYDGEQKI